MDILKELNWRFWQAAITAFPQLIGKKLYYTLGHTESYEKYFEEQRQPMKMGKTHNYSGGSIFFTKESAEKHVKECDGYSVYGVLCSEEDVEIVDGCEWGNLIKSSVLVRLKK